LQDLASSTNGEQLSVKHVELIKNLSNHIGDMGPVSLEMLEGERSANLIDIFTHAVKTIATTWLAIIESMNTFMTTKQAPAPWHVEGYHDRVRVVTDCLSQFQVFGVKLPGCSEFLSKHRRGMQNMVNIIDCVPLAFKADDPADPLDAASASDWIMSFRCGNLSDSLLALLAPLRDNDAAAVIVKDCSYCHERQVMAASHRAGTPHSKTQTRRQLQEKTTSEFRTKIIQ
jgi:hypothetical protein